MFLILEPQLSLSPSLAAFQQLAKMLGDTQQNVLASALHNQMYCNFQSEAFVGASSINQRQQQPQRRYISGKPTGSLREILIHPKSLFLILT